MIQLKYIRETNKSRSHHEVYFRNTYLGYIIKDISPWKKGFPNWYFVSGHEYMNMAQGETKQIVIGAIQRQLKTLTLD